MGFRYFTIQQAKELGINGWVTNRSDGTVEALLQGKVASVDEMIERLHRGPIAAKVTEIKEIPVTDSPENYRHFTVRR